MGWMWWGGQTTYLSSPKRGMEDDRIDVFDIEVPQRPGNGLGDLIRDERFRIIRQRLRGILSVYTRVPAHGSALQTYRKLPAWRRDLLCLHVHVLALTDAFFDSLSQT